MVLIHVETVFPAVFTCFHTCENTMTFTRRHLYALLFLPPCLLQSVPSLSPPADDSVSEGGRSVSNHRQHPDERTEFTLPRHLHHPPVPSARLCLRQCAYGLAASLLLMLQKFCRAFNFFFLCFRPLSKKARATTGCPTETLRWTSTRR